MTGRDAPGLADDALWRLEPLARKLKNRWTCRVDMTYRGAHDDSSSEEFSSRGSKCGGALGVSAPAQGQHFAARAGFSVNPDQFYGGGQYDIGPLFNGVWLQPGADLGRGDGATLVATSFDVTYRKSLQRNGVWTGYVGDGSSGFL